MLRSIIDEAYGRFILSFLRILSVYSQSGWTNLLSHDNLIPCSGLHGHQHTHAHTNAHIQITLIKVHLLIFVNYIKCIKVLGY